MSPELRPNIFPALRYHDAGAALDWLQRAFGFAEKAVHRGEDGGIHHAELSLGAGIVMFGQHDEGGWLGGEPPQPLASTVSIYVVVPDPDAHYERAQAAGARIVRELGGPHLAQPHLFAPDRFALHFVDAGIQSSLAL